MPALFGSGHSRFPFSVSLDGTEPCLLFCLFVVFVVTIIMSISVDCLSLFVCCCECLLFCLIAVVTVCSFARC